MQQRDLQKLYAATPFTIPFFNRHAINRKSTNSNKSNTELRLCNSSYGKTVFDIIESISPSFAAPNYHPPIYSQRTLFISIVERSYSIIQVLFQRNSFVLRYRSNFVSLLKNCSQMLLIYDFINWYLLLLENRIKG